MTRKMDSRQGRESRSGWTLMELMVVVTLIAMIVSMATVNFKGPLRRTQYESAVEQIKNADHVLRRSCLKTNKSHALTLDPKRNLIEYEIAGRRKLYSLPADVKLEHWLDSSGMQNNSATLIEYDSRGGSETYGVCISLGVRKKWLVFLGRTGEFLELEHEYDTHELFESIRSIGANTD